jgi:hypothetical protein
MLNTLKLITCAGILGLSVYPLAYAQAEVSKSLYDTHPDWVQVPGKLVRPECVHEIPSGAKVETKNGQITGDVTLKGEFYAHYEPCAEEAISTRHLGMTKTAGHAPTGNGWVEATQWDDSGQNVNLIYGYWTVPSAPAASGGLIYLFNGIEPTSENWILQPVLQYGVGYAGGGNYWAIASWLVGPSYVFHSPLETVNSGDQLFGYTEVTGTSGSTLDWRVEAYDDNTGANSWITATSNGLTWSWAFASVLEAYNINSCSNFPASGATSFIDTEVYQGTSTYTLTNPGWYGAIYGYGGPSCGFGVGVSGTTSTLYY